jgi:predicted GH43/DUF377 family glycosyl hydrolase
VNKWQVIVGPDDIPKREWEEEGGVEFLVLKPGFAWAIYHEKRIVSSGAAESEIEATVAARAELDRLQNV